MLSHSSRSLILTIISGVFTAITVYTHQSAWIAISVIAGLGSLLVAIDGVGVCIREAIERRGP